MVRRAAVGREEAPIQSADRLCLRFSRCPLILRHALGGGVESRDACQRLVTFRKALAWPSPKGRRVLLVTGTLLCRFECLLFHKAPSEPRQEATYYLCTQHTRYADLHFVRRVARRCSMGTVADAGRAWQQARNVVEAEEGKGRRSPRSVRANKNLVDQTQRDNHHRRSAARLQEPSEGQQASCRTLRPAVTRPQERSRQVPQTRDARRVDVTQLGLL